MTQKRGSFPGAILVASLIAMAVMGFVHANSQSGVAEQTDHATPAATINAESSEVRGDDGADDGVTTATTTTTDASAKESTQKAIGETGVNVGGNAGVSVGGGLLPKGANVAVIPISGLIYDFTLESLERRVDRAINKGQASMIVLELDTPGGVVTSALKISRYIKSLPVPTVAWVHSEAYSAGILIASSCDEIVMSSASATGDCAPIVPGSELAPTERAKALSPILEEFRDNASDNGYPYVLFHAMCVLGVEVYEIEKADTGERRYVHQADYQFLVQGQDGAGQSFLKSVFGGSTTNESTTNVGEPVRDPALSDEDRGQWKLVQQVHDGKTLLTLSQSRAMDVGLARAIVNNETELKTYLGASAVGTVNQSWSETIVAMLVHPAVKAILMAGLMLGIYFELQSPGVGLPGLMAVIAAVAIFGAPYLVGLAEVWHLLIFMLGVGLLAVEIFVLPGFGVAGVSGILCILVGVVFASVPASGSGPIPLPPREVWGMLQASLIWTLAGLFIGMIGIGFLLRHVENIPFLRQMVLQSPVAVAGGPVVRVSGDEAIGEGKLHVGDTGQVISELRPTGRARIGDQVVDVVSAGSWIELGTKVRITEMHGNRIVVESV